MKIGNAPEAFGNNIVVDVEVKTILERVDERAFIRQKGLSSEIFILDEMVEEGD